MSLIERSALVPHPAQHMFDLVNRVDAYPRRFNWCSDAAVLEESATLMLARLELRIAGLRVAFVTRNTLLPGEQIDMALVEGPFRQLSGQWQFRPIGDLGSRISLSLAFEADSRLLGSAFRVGFSSLADRMVADFVSEADRDEPRNHPG